MKKPSRKRRPEFGTRHPSRSSKEVTILYEDDALIVINKPAGLPAVPIPKSHVPSALSLLSDSLRTRKQKALIVHRIDRFTSGTLLFAKTDKDRAALIRQFLDHTPVRRYLAMVRGYLQEEEGKLVHYLRRSGMFQMLSTQKNAEAARAELDYSVVRRLRNASLVHVTLATGLQNQIRVQFAAVGHPVIGDRKYHPSEAEESRIDRVALHADYLQFQHPRTGKDLAIDCKPPADFQALVKALAPPSEKRD